MHRDLKYSVRWSAGISDTVCVLMGETLITARAGANRGYPDGGYELLSAGFASYAEAISSSSFGSNSKARIAELENQWHACGLTG